MPETPSHLTAELLSAVAAGEISSQDLLQKALVHLEGLCPICRDELRVWKAQHDKRPMDYRLALHVLPPLLARHWRDMEREEKAAQKALLHLLRFPREERAQRILRSRTRWASPGVVRLLLRLSREEVAKNPVASLHYADLARTALLRNPAMSGAFDLLVVATAQTGNGYRLLGNPRKAIECFAHARYLIRSQEITEGEVLARVDELEASLLRDQRRLEDAEQLLERASLLYRRAGSPQASARVLLNLGSVYFHENRLGKACEATERALQRLDSESEPRLYLCARYNLALYLTRLGKPASAVTLLTEDQALYHQSTEPGMRLRLAWIQGDLAALQGDVEKAERLYLEARNGFIRERDAFDVAMVSLDLALLYLGEGRAREVRKLADEMVVLFRAEGVRREALAALLLLNNATRQEISA